jgi:translation initiation factor IF-2
MENKNKALIIVATNFRWNKEARKTAKRLDVKLVQATHFPKAARSGERK